MDATSTATTTTITPSDVRFDRWSCFSAVGVPQEQGSKDEI